MTNFSPSSYPQIKAADAHKGQVREYQAPKAPQAPSAPSSSELGSELESFASSEPDHAEHVASTESVVPEQRQDVRAFLEEAKKPIVDEHH
ncbi:uncharacterized protein FA14DRAFT_15268 [Meira miltonrushii]|uniref:Uncharacterized protein n=1 Tax=Meira miltonrushii TaxID=1280837 RepID=A0A316VIS2_9BASI|nr:uncharacterized protein FA14DRAFT_15268 [Meira miltonrushii]PWN37529.1 hypothetical protein FA14DRAFT_15268 [Meira miltonrushii]